MQTALATALTVWLPGGVPSDPAAWLYRVAHNQLLAELRKGATRQRILAVAAGELEAPDGGPPEARLPGEVRDDLLRMLFVCCDDSIPRESGLVLALKTLCGFSTSEIALRLFTSEANVHKRLQRARDRLREAAFDELTSVPIESLRARLGSVHEVLYLLFNEGYLSLRAEAPIRDDLCEEAIRLASLLAEHAVGAVPETYALLALMCFHVARLASRVDGDGGLVLLEEQDRGRWDRERIGLGAEWLARAASGETFSRFHAEAGIAAEHCFAASFAETRWSEIADLYAMLERIAPSPLHTMNRAVAVAEWQGPKVALELLQQLAPPPWLDRTYLWEAVLADLYRRSGDSDSYEHHRRRALDAAPTDAVRVLLARRFG